MAVAAGCGSDSSGNGDIDLPDRDPKKDAGSGETSTPTTDSGPVTPGTDCSKMGKVSDRPACDTCVKAKCCEEVAACDKSNDCKALQACLAPCASDDLFCVFECQAAHSSGEEKLREVGSCAQLECKSECPSEVDGGDPFGDSGL